MDELLTDSRILPSIDELGLTDSNIVQVNCQRSINVSTDSALALTDNFNAGVQDFQFSVSGQQRWSPQRSYFRADVELRVDGAATAGPVVLRQPLATDGISFAEDFMNCLYSNAYCYAGNVNISSLSQYVSVASMVRYRLSKSQQWLESIGKSVFFLDPDLDSRIATVASDPSTTVRSAAELGFVDTNTVAIPAADPMVATFAVGVVPDCTLLWRAGDLFAYTDDAGLRQQYVVASSTATTVTSIAIGANCGVWAVKVIPAANIIRGRESTSTLSPADGKNRIQINFQPPLGIFSTSSVMAAGSYKISLMPKNDKQSAIQNKNASSTLRWSIGVHSVYFFCSIFRDNKAFDNGTYYLSLDECNIQNKTASSGASQTSHNFTVPSSTLGLAVVAQATSAGAAGSSTVPPSVFKALDGSAADLQNLQLSFANTTKPLQNYDSAQTATAQRLSQRYYDTMTNADLELSSGESFADWLTRGGLYYFSWVRPADDRSTELQLQASWGAIAGSNQVFLISIYRKLVQIEVSNGYVSSVVSLSM